MTHKSTIATAIGLIMIASGPAYGEQIKTYSGQPLCSDQDGLLALFIAGIHGDARAMNAVPGCQVIPAASTAEVIERLPIGIDFMQEQEAGRRRDYWIIRGALLWTDCKRRYAVS